MMIKPIACFQTLQSTLKEKTCTVQSNHNSDAANKISMLIG